MRVMLKWTALSERACRGVNQRIRTDALLRTSPWRGKCWTKFYMGLSMLTTLKPCVAQSLISESGGGRNHVPYHLALLPKRGSHGGHVVELFRGVVSPSSTTSTAAAAAAEMGEGNPVKWVEEQCCFLLELSCRTLSWAPWMMKSLMKKTVLKIDALLMTSDLHKSYPLPGAPKMSWSNMVTYGAISPFVVREGEGRVAQREEAIDQHDSGDSGSFYPGSRRRDV